MKMYKPTKGEEIANSVSHGVMSILTLMLLPFSAVWGYITYGALASTCISIYIISIFLMFLSSTLYHLMERDTAHKDVLHVIDHIMIYVAIAGTYTPIALGVIGGWQGIVIVAIQWVMVIVGVFYKSLSHKSLPALSLAIYMIMGWTIVVFAIPFVRNASPILIGLILLGGLLYSAGALVYARKGFKYHHLVWHIFINLAMISHFVAIIFFL